MEHRQTLVFGRIALLSEVGPDLFRCGRYPLLDGTEAVDRGTDVEREHRRAILERRRRVVVNHIADLFSSFRAANDPVVPVERGLGTRAKIRQISMEYEIHTLESRRK